MTKRQLKVVVTQENERLIPHTTIVQTTNVLESDSNHVFTVTTNTNTAKIRWKLNDMLPGLFERVDVRYYKTD